MGNDCHQRFPFCPSLNGDVQPFPCCVALRLGLGDGSHLVTALTRVVTTCIRFSVRHQISKVREVVKLHRVGFFFFLKKKRKSTFVISIVDPFS